MTALGRSRGFAGLLAGAMLRRQPAGALLAVAAVALVAGMVLRVACTFSASSDRLDAMVADAALHFDRVVVEDADTDGDGGSAMDAAIVMPHPALPEGLLDFVRGHGAVAACVAGSVATVEVYPGPEAAARNGGMGRRGGQAPGPARGAPGGPAPDRPRKAPPPPEGAVRGHVSTNITDPMFRMAGWVPGEMALCPLFSPEPDAMPPGVDAEAWQRCLAEGSLAVPSSIARQFGLAAGDTVYLAGAGGRSLVPVGAVYGTGGAGMVRGLFPVHAPRGLFEAVAGAPWRPNRAYVRLRPERAREFDGAFAAALDSLSGGGAPAALLGPAHWRKAAAPAARGRGGGSGFDAIPYSAVFLANAAALFLLLSTLAMNVQAQRRELAVLRAIGAPAWMPALAVLFQGLGLAAAGWVVGAAFGLHGFRGTLPEAARGWGHVLALARNGLWISALPVLAATLLACVPAVWMVARLHPLEEASPAAARTGRAAFAWGLALLALHPALAWTPLARGALAQGLVLPASYLLGMAGAILMVPGLLRALARALARPLGLLLGLHPLLLRDHNQSGLWQQTLGAAALVVSLAFYLTTAIWGESMRRPFVAGDKVQDAIAMYLPNGPLAGRAGEIASLPGVTSDCAMRLTHLQLAATDALAGKFFAGAGEIILLRTDLDRFLGGIDHRLVAGRTGPLGDGECVVMDQMPITDPDAFRLGKPFGVYPLEDDPEGEDAGGGCPPIDRARSELVPVGVLDIPGWQLITKSTRMRRGMNRSLSLVFVNDATFDRYAPHIRENCHWLSLAPGTSMQALQNALDGLRPFPAAYVKLTDIAAAQDMVNRRSDSVIAPLLRLPLMVLGLSSLAVLVSLAAAAWSRRRAYTLLDALGLTRFQLVRLLLGEAVLLAVAAVLLGTLLALLFAQTGILLCDRMMSVRAPYVFPWGAFATGAAATLGATLAAAALAIPLLCRRSGPADALSGADRS